MSHVQGRPRPIPRRTLVCMCHRLHRITPALLRVRRRRRVATLSPAGAGKQRSCLSLNVSAQRRRNTRRCFLSCRIDQVPIHISAILLREPNAVPFKTRLSNSAPTLCQSCLPNGAMTHARMSGKGNGRHLGVRWWRKPKSQLNDSMSRRPSDGARSRSARPLARRA